jgi:transposase-like protein
MDKNKEKNGRKFWSADEKIGIIRKHISKAKIVETCNENSVPPPTFSDWLKLVLEISRDALAGTNNRKVRLT